MWHVSSQYVLFFGACSVIAEVKAAGMEETLQTGSRQAAERLWRRWGGKNDILFYLFFFFFTKKEISFAFKQSCVFNAEFTRTYQWCRIVVAVWQLVIIYFLLMYRLLKSRKLSREPGDGLLVLLLRSALGAPSAGQSFPGPGIIRVTLIVVKFKLWTNHSWSERCIDGKQIKDRQSCSPCDRVKHQNCLSNKTELCSGYVELCVMNSMYIKYSVILQTVFWDVTFQLIYSLMENKHIAKFVMTSLNTANTADSTSLSLSPNQKTL